ncbi:hypothetical protein C8A05DRAFT_18250, partial [Staphylotrichum tortipilum]
VAATALKQFVKNTIRPRIYFLGRSKESGARITAELQKLNPEGEYHYLSVDVSTIKAVDKVSAEIIQKEQAINLLFLSTGTLLTGKDTDEGLHYPMAVAYYARIRLAVNLLPLLRRATALRRVVSVFAGTKEGRVDTAEFQARNIPLLAQRGHGASAMTLALEAVARDAPEVSLVHDFPGAVKTNLGKDVKSVPLKVLTAVFGVIAPLVTIPVDEAGERQLFFSTSARFPPRTAGEGEGSGVPLAAGVEAARGTDGKPGSGVYSIGVDGESAKAKVEELLAGYRGDGTLEKVWELTEGEFTRITAAASA